LLRLSSSFSKKEIEVVCSVLLMLGRKGDPTILMGSKEMQSVTRKFLSMKERARLKEAS